RLAVVRLPILIKNRNDRTCSLLSHMNAERSRLGRVFRTKHTRQEVALLDFLAGIGIQVAYEIISGRTVTIVDRETRRIKRYTHPAPSAIKRLIQCQRRLAFSSFDELWF